MANDQELITGITGSSLDSNTPQFSTAEYSHVPGTERCRICSSLISGEYFRVNSQMACARCAEEARLGQPRDSHAAFARGLVLGIGAAVVGLIVYSTFTIVTGWSIGYIALAVGWLVAKAITKGSNGMGGLRYQVAAVVLTYAAISLAAVPIWISYGIKHRQQTTVQGHAATQTGTNAATAGGDTAGQPQAAPRPKPEIHLGKLLVQLLFVGLASPFLALRNPFNGLMGLVILFVGLSIAFRMTAAKPLEVDGPYNVNG